MLAFEAAAHNQDEPDGHFEWVDDASRSHRKWVLRHGNKTLEGDFGMEWSISEVDITVSRELVHLPNKAVCCVRRLGSTEQGVRMIHPNYKAPTTVAAISAPFKDISQTKIVTFLAWGLNSELSSDDMRYFRRRFPPTEPVINSSNDMLARIDNTRAYVLRREGEDVSIRRRVHQFEVALSLSEPGVACSSDEQYNVVIGKFGTKHRFLLRVGENGLQERFYDVSQMPNFFKGCLLWGLPQKEVYCGRELRDGRYHDVVLKVIQSNRPDLVASWQRERNMLAWIAQHEEWLNAPALSLRGTGMRTDACHVLVLPFFRRRSLQTFFENPDSFPSAFAERESVSKFIIHDVLQGLAFLHANDAAHLDISLENIVLNERFRCVVIDFGESRFKTDCPVDTATIGRKVPFWDPTYVRSYYQCLLEELENVPCGRVLLEMDDLCRMDLWCLGISLAILLMGQEPGKHLATVMAARRDQNLPLPVLEMSALPATVDARRVQTCRWVDNISTTLEMMVENQLSDDVASLLSLLLLGVDVTAEQVLGHLWIGSRDESQRQEHFSGVRMTSGVRRNYATAMVGTSTAHNHH